MSDPCGCLSCQDAWAETLPPETPIHERFPGAGRRGWRFACELCGNKRCPHHSDHRLECTRSNAPGQPGSVYA